MKKLKLDLDTIQVLSFTVENEHGAGTVNGFAPDTQVGCGGGGSWDSCTCRLCLPVPISDATDC